MLENLDFVSSTHYCITSMLQNGLEDKRFSTLLLIVNTLQGSQGRWSASTNQLSYAWILSGVKGFSWL
jgi:hypothetical protein